MSSFLAQRIRQKGGTIIASCKDSGKSLDTQTAAQKSIELFLLSENRLAEMLQACTTFACLPIVEKMRTI